MQQSLLAAVSVATLLWAGMAQAQTPQVLNIGSDVRGVLESGDSRTSGDESVVYDDYLISLARGQKVQFDLSAGDFDAYLEVYRQGEREPLESNDDGTSSGMDARLRFTAKEAGQYVVRARPFVGTSGGHYRLTVEESQPINYGPAQPIALGEEKAGQLSLSDKRTDENGRAYALYSLSAREGDRVAISLSSDDFDTVVSLGRMVEGEYEELAENDDGPNHQLNSYLLFTPPETGTYLIKVLSVSNEGEGDYSLSVSEGPKAPSRRPIAFDETIEGSLNEESGQGENGTPAAYYSFRGREGQRVSITLKSDDFDAYVELRDENLESLASDDDSGGELNSRLVYSLTKDGTYVIEARGLSEASGDYELKLEALAPPPPPKPLRFGQTLEGEIKSDTALDDEGKAYAAYVFEGSANQRVQVTVRSGDFDALTQIGKTGEPFEALGSDDDGLRQGTDARLNFTLPEDGTYEVRALTFGSDMRGLYSIELVDRGAEPLPGSLLIPSVARGSLGDLDSLDDEGISYDAYRFKAKRDEKLRFTLISSDFDAVVEVGEDKDGDWRSLESDDDSLSDTHARLDWTAPRDGSYSLRVRSYAPGTGQYVLTAERQP